MSLHITRRAAAVKMNHCDGALCALACGVQVTSFDCRLSRIWFRRAIINSSRPTARKELTHEDQLLRAARHRRQPSRGALHTEWQDSGNLQPVHPRALERQRRRDAPEQPGQITAWEPLASFGQQRLRKGTRIEVTGRIEQQSWGEGESRQYKTVLVASEIMLLSNRSDAALATEEPAPADEQADQEPDVAPAAKAEPKRRRAKRAA
jgi:hypothetical protein